MRRIRFFVALWAAKLSYVLMRLLGKNATYLPGQVALKLCKDFLGQLTPPKTVIAVTGTNGKTTVSNLLNAILTHCGFDITNNSLGSNVQAGVTTALLVDATLTGKAKKEMAVLEVDERSSLLIYPYLKPDYLICNNIMRDSLKRNAHTDFITFIINKALPASTKVILNADDLICANLAPSNQDRTYFGLDVEKPTQCKTPFVQDIVYCPHCGGELQADYLRYNHIGRMHCPQCGRTSPERDFLVTALDRVHGTFTLRHNGKDEVYPLLNDNIVNIYNFCGVVALCTKLGLSPEQIRTAMSCAKIVKTRYEQVTAGDLHIVVQASKAQNPIATARAMDYAAACPGGLKAVVLLLDDRSDNNGNSESTCWLYDCDYSYLANPSIGQIIFAGPRCKDHYLRALIAGVDGDKILQCSSFTVEPSLVNTRDCKEIYILHDVYLNHEAEVLKNQLVQCGKEGQ